MFGRSSSLIGRLFLHSFPPVASLLSSSTSEITSPTFVCASGMKISFKIATELTVHVVIAITIITSSLTALAMISIILGNPTISIYCAIVLALILWLVLIVHFPIANTVRMPTALTPPPPPISTAELKSLKKKHHHGPQRHGPSSSSRLRVSPWHQGSSCWGGAWG